MVGASIDDAASKNPWIYECAEDLLTLPDFDSADEGLPTSPETSENDTAFPVPDEGRPVTFNPLGGCNNHTGTFKKRPLLACAFGDLACDGKWCRRALQAARPPTVAQDEPPRQEASAPAEQPESGRAPQAANPASSAPVTPPGEPTEKLVTPPRGLRQLRQWPSTATKKKLVSSAKKKKTKKKLVSSAKKKLVSSTATEKKKRMVIHHRQAYGQSYVLKNIPHGRYNSKTFSYRDYGGQARAHRAAKKHMNELTKEQPSTASSPPA